ncbi:MAG: two-component regulator propeller domain-containing protein, partial [Kiritimatiellales bacterium]
MINFSSIQKTRLLCVGWILILLQPFKAPAEQASLIFLPGRSHVIRSWTVADGLPFNQIRDIIQRRNGFIWVATLNGAARFDGVEFEVFNTENYPELPNNRMVKLYEDAKGALYIAHDTGHISILTQGGFRVVDPPPQISATGVVDFHEDVNGGIWAEYGSGLWLELVHNGSFLAKPVPCERPPDLFPGRTCGWQVQGEEVVFLDAGGKVQQDRGKRPWIIAQDVVFLERANGELVAGTTFGGIFIFRDGVPPQRYNSKDGLLSDRILSLCEDVEGNLWLGTAAGLQCFRDNRFAAIYPDVGLYYRPWSITPRRAGGVWIGGNKQELHFVDNLLFRQRFPTHGTSHPLRTLLEDRDGRLWANANGRFLLREADDGFEDYFPDGVETDQLWAQLECTNGDCLVGGDKGLWRRRADVWAQLFGEKDGVDCIRCLEQAPDGTIWIGMEAEGLAALRGEQLTRYSSATDSFSSYITALHIDRTDESLWVGTCGNGLMRLVQGQLVRTALPRHTVAGIQEDDSGRLWCVTDKGITVVEKARLVASSFATDSADTAPIVMDQDDGIPPVLRVDEVLQTMCRTEDGGIWVLADRLILKFDPAKIQRCTDPVPVVIREIQSNDRRIGLTEGASISLPPGQHRLDIHFSALRYTAPNRLHFRCRMQGLDRE